MMPRSGQNSTFSKEITCDFLQVGTEYMYQYRTHPKIKPRCSGAKCTT